MSGYNFTRSRVCGTVKAAIPYCNGGGCASYWFDGGQFEPIPKDGSLSPKDYFEKRGYEVMQDDSGNGKALDDNMNIVAKWGAP